MAARLNLRVGGSLRQSENYYDRALEIAPANPVTLLYAAELAMARKQTPRAERLLELLLSLPDGPNWEYEGRRDRELARELLKRMAIA